MRRGTIANQRAKYQPREIFNRGSLHELRVLFAFAIHGSRKSRTPIKNLSDLSANEVPARKSPHVCSSRNSVGQSGFTLIELLIVVAILALVSIIAIPSISNTFRFSVKSAGREIATLIKDAANSSQISGKIHRIAYDLKKDQYWVESTSETALLQSEESRKIEAERRSIFDDNKNKEPDKKGFRQEGLLTKNKRSLPVGVSFKDIYTEQSEEAITEGMAYTHIFPQGMSEKTLIHLIDTSKNEISIVVSNLLARCSIDGRYIEYQEVFKKR